MPTPRLLPMLATPGTVALVSGPGWVHEFKWDGVRALVASDGRRVQVRSRTGNDVTAGYPELQALATELPADTVLDGEIVAFGADGAPSFPRLQRRMHLRDELRVAAASADVPIRFLVFDVLMVAGQWRTDAPWRQRRAHLEGLELLGDAWAVPPVADDLTSALRAADARGLEGVVSKRADSPYRVGARSPEWRKLRLVREQDVVVGGWRHGTGQRAGTFGSLLVGVRDGQGLAFAGAVGSGFTDRETARLAELLGELRQPRSPFLNAPDAAGVTWVRPQLVVVVRYREWTPGGRLRQPSYRGQRPDVDPMTVRRED